MSNYLENITVTAETATEVWETWWDILLKQRESGFLQPSRIGDVVGEVMNAVTVITNPKKGLVSSDIRKLSTQYAVGELLWYLSGSNLLSGIQPYSKAWDDLTDDGDTINSAYGHRIYHKFGFDQWEFVKTKLQQDPNSRQAVIHIKEASNLPTKDTPCTVCLQFNIRNGELNLTTYMRSNDLWLGFPYDVFAFTCLQVKMAMELGVPVSSYTHIACSLHLYSKSLTNFEKQVINSETQKS